MGGVRGRVERLERATAGGYQEWVCPRCGEVFGYRGDAAVDLLVADWAEGSSARQEHEPSPALSRILRHPHAELRDEIWRDIPGPGGAAWGS